MPDTTLSRKQLEDKAKHDSDIADLKQHSDKLIQGFENSSPTDAKRALWELIQNARDLSKEAQIEVTLKPDEFTFTHHGATFTPNTLLCLIKQVSSKNRKKKEQKETEDEVKEVGQYGTGFITTHSLGKRFYVDGTIELQPGEYIILKDFLIDRVALDSDILSEKLLKQQNEVFRLIREGEPTNSPLPTTFRYQFDDPTELTNAKITLSENTELLIPSVMALNGGIKSIKIARSLENDKSVSLFQKLNSGIEGDLAVIKVQKNSEPENKIYVLHVDQELDLKIIVPLTDLSKAFLPKSSMSRLFLYFPLIGTENWGTNFIIHCGLFNPHVERDGIWISSDNLQNKEKEKNNQEILEKASSAIFKFMADHALEIDASLNLANISFPTASGNAHLDKYFKELKEKWVLNFKTYAIVQTGDKKKQPQECNFISEEMMQLPEYVKGNYDLLSFFYNPLPEKSIAEDWTKTIRLWEDPSTKWITIKDICENIQGTPVDSISSELLLPFYEYLLKIGANKYFEDFKLLPTFNKNFAVKTGLFRSTPLHSLFIEMASMFTPKVPDHLVDDAYIKGHNFNDYTRNELSKQLNPAIREQAATLKENVLLIDTARNLLIRFCNSFPSLENKGARGELMKVILDFYKISLEPTEIPNVGDDKIDYSAAVECLIKNTIWDFQTRAVKDKDWIRTNLNTVKDLITVLTNYKEYSEIITNLPAFVNQNFSLITKGTALIQEGIPDDLKTLYHQIFKKDVNDELLHDDFVPFLKDGKKLEGGQLAMEISKYINDHGAIEAITEHPDSALIMKIIQKISDTDKEKGPVWAKLFPAINAARATIVMATITREERKENLFSIITLEDDEKVALLGLLAKEESMEIIIEYGRAMWHDEQNRQIDFEIKHKIGKHVEDLLRERIKGELNELQIEVQVIDEQKGKDVIIKKGNKILYYLEIKSRWRSDYSIRMSRLQAETAAKNQDHYSLIGINMVDYFPADGDRHAPQDVNLIMDRISILESIGETVLPLVENAMNISDHKEEIHLGPEYAIVIPQPVFKNHGISFETFMDDLTIELESKLKQPQNVEN